MPEAVAIAVADYFAFEVVGTTVAQAAFIETAVAFTARIVVLNASSRILAKKPSGGANGQLISGRSALAPHQIIYGRTRIGGTIVHMEATDSNKYLHMVIAVAGHEIDAFEKIYFDDAEVTLDGSGIGYDNKVRVQFGLGSSSQTAFTDLVTESEVGWSSNHRLRGIACAYVRLEYNADKFPNGLPNISFLVRGKQVYDPRSSTTAWSANPALCINDYLTSTSYGLGCTYANEIDATALIAAANICDEDVPLDAGGTENRYECHGVIATSQRPADAIKVILGAMSGKAIFSGGKWRILAGAYYSPTLTLDENDLRGGFRVQSLMSRRDSFNCIKGVFSSAEDQYVPTDFPPIISSTFIAEDNGETVYQNIELPMTTSPSMAQRLAKIELLKARQQITLSLPLKLTGLQANVGDVVQITNTRMGWSAKAFEVISLNISLGGALGVDLELRETATNVYDWDASEEQAFDPAPNTNLPNPFTVGAVSNVRFNVTNFYTAANGVLEWDCSDALVNEYDVEVVGGIQAAYLNANPYQRFNNAVFTVTHTGYTRGWSGRSYATFSITINNIASNDVSAFAIGDILWFSGTTQVHNNTVLADLVIDKGITVKTKVYNSGTSQLNMTGLIGISYSAAPSTTSLLILTDTGSGGADIAVYPYQQRITPATGLYLKATVQERKFGDAQFMPGDYQITITPRNVLGAAGTPLVSFVELPAPPLPNRVSGLELDLGSDGQANASVWTGKDVKIKWRHASFTTGYEINDEEANGAEDGMPDPYLKDYKVAVYNASDTLLREEFVTTNAYVYSFEKNAEDAAKLGQSVYRTLSFKIWARGYQNQISELPAIL